MALVSLDLPLGNIGDLTTPTSTAQYPLGLVKVFKDTTNNTIAKYIYVKAHAALTAYQPYVLDPTGTAGADFTTLAPATIAAPGAQVVIPQVAFTSGYFGFVLLAGVGKVLMTAETYAVGDALQLLNTGTALVVDGTTGSTVTSVNTSAVCMEAGSTAVARACILLEGKAVVAAS